MSDLLHCRYCGDGEWGHTTQTCHLPIEIRTLRALETLVECIERIEAKLNGTVDVDVQNAVGTYEIANANRNLRTF